MGKFPNRRLGDSSPIGNEKLSSNMTEYFGHIIRWVNAKRAINLRHDVFLHRFATENLQTKLWKYGKYTEYITCSTEATFLFKRKVINLNKWPCRKKYTSSKIITQLFNLYSGWLFGGIKWYTLRSDSEHVRLWGWGIVGSGPLFTKQ